MSNSSCIPSNYKHLQAAPANPKFDLLVFITRAQGFHIGHEANVIKALQNSNKVVVIVGSSGGARDSRNPFTFQERKEMIEGTFPNIDRLQVVPLRDYPYNDTIWASYVQKIVSDLTKDDPTMKVGIVGHRKADTIYYLDMFPQWEFLECPSVIDINATTIRTNWFASNIEANEKYLSEFVQQYFIDFRENQREIFDLLTREYQFIKNYRKSWEAAPFPPTFVTVDAVVIQAGHILLIRRKKIPGRGLWAMPGGYLEQDERTLTGMLRELNEETKLKVPEKVLLGSIKGRDVYDHPTRSLRGRVLTHAYLIHLPEGPLSKVKGSDDADKAMWVPISDFYKMQDQMFEDHFFVIDDLIHRFTRIQG